MKREHIQFYSLLLTIIMLFSGMCPQSLRADSFLSYTKTIVNEVGGNQGGEFIEPCYSKISKLPICTAKMLGEKKGNGQIFCQERTGIKKVASCCKKIPKSQQAAIILDYIHNMDGKKKLS